MTDNQNELLAVFEVRLRDLLALCDERKREITALTEQLQRERKNMELLRIENRELKSKNAGLLAAHAAGADAGDMRRAADHVSNLVCEIDRCLALLKRQG